MFRLGGGAAVLLQVILREGEGACSDDRRTFTTYPGRLRACQSSPRLTRPGVMFLCLSLHLLITLCSDQRAASKPEQETGAKGGSSLFLALRRSWFPDTSSNSLGELSAERSDACPGQAVPSSPLLSLYFAKTAFRRRRLERRAGMVGGC